jgi:hypothetical protein
VDDVDLSRLPLGEMGWAALVAYAAASDDRIERYFLEVKSDVDLNTKAGRAKVAKFILGAANRDPGQVARRFGGHAVMLLGVGSGTTHGIAAFEAQDLARDVARWVGVDGPTWDFERIRAGQLDVIAVVVDPPTGDVWTCRADGDGLANGDIYVRADGNTRKATGDEVRAMVSRARSSSPMVDVEIEMLGEVNALGVDLDFLGQWIDWREVNYRMQAEPKPDSGSAAHGLAAFMALNMTHDTRSVAEFLAEVSAWHEKAVAAPVDGIVSTAGRLFAGVRVRIKNRTKTFLHDVRLDIGINDSVRATDWLDPERAEPIDLFPDSPIDMGMKDLSQSIALAGIAARSATFPRSRHGILDIRRGEPAKLVMMMDSLRPQEEFVSDDDEVVLVMVDDADPGSAVTGSWRMTAGEVNDVYEGEFSIPVRYRDWREPIRELLTDEGPGDPSVFADGPLDL